MIWLDECSSTKISSSLDRQLLGGVQQQKRSCRREKPKMSFVFFVLFCSFSKHVQNRRFCAQFGQKCVLKKEQKRSWFWSFLIFIDLFCSFLLFLPDFVNKMSSNREQKRTKKIMPPGKSQDVLCLFCCWTPPNFDVTSANKPGTEEDDVLLRWQK